MGCHRLLTLKDQYDLSRKPYFIPACILSCSVISDSFATSWTVTPALSGGGLRCHEISLLGAFWIPNEIFILLSVCLFCVSPPACPVLTLIKNAHGNILPGKTLSYLYVQLNYKETL